MNVAGAAWLCLLAAWSSGCSAVEDVVFDVLTIDVETEARALREGAGRVEIPLRLNRPPNHAVPARYRLIELDAQSACQAPDFLDAEGSVTFAAGEQETSLSVWIGDDALAETDERFMLSIEASEGSSALGDVAIPLVILDDDRSGLVDAGDFGVVPGASSDQTESLQRALEAARALGRGVVVMTPGDYVIDGVRVAPGTTLSARGARFHRPALAPPERVAVLLEYQGDSDSDLTLVEGLALDGRRDEQGEYRNNELAEAHLIALHGTAASKGRLRAAIQGVELEASTGSGVFVGPQVDAALCRVQGFDLWRDLVTLRGGGSRVEAHGLEASSMDGTTGLWFDGQPAGYDASHRIEVSLVDVQLATGDLELEAYAGSHIEIERLSMARGPLRLHAPDGTVRIKDSLLHLGIPSASHNYWSVPHDVEVRRSTLVADETDAAGLEPPEADRQLSAVLVRWELGPEPPPNLPGLLPFAPGPHRLLFDACTFQSSSAVEVTDRVHAVEAVGAGGEVVLRAPTLGETVLEPFAPECSGCALEP